MVFRCHAATGSPSRSHFWLLYSDFCLSYLSPLPPIRSALFCTMERSQYLWNQSLAHSFPCNGGATVSSLAFSLATRLRRASRGNSLIAASFYFQRLTHCPICNLFVLITMQQWGG